MILHLKIVSGHGKRLSKAKQIQESCSAKFVQSMLIRHRVFSYFISFNLKNSFSRKSASFITMNSKLMLGVLCMLISY